MDRWNLDGQFIVSPFVNYAYKARQRSDPQLSNGLHTKQCQIASAVPHKSAPSLRNYKPITKTYQLMHARLLVRRQRTDLLRRELEHLNQHLLFTSPPRRSVRDTGLYRQGTKDVHVDPRTPCSGPQQSPAGSHLAFQARQRSAAARTQRMPAARG